MEIGKIIALLAGLAVLFAVLYRSGLMVVKQIRALVYIDRKWGRRVTFQRCTGTVRRVFRVRETRTYRVTLQSTLTGGNIKTEILDREKRPLLTLTPEKPNGQALLVRGTRYWLVHNYDGASGEMELEVA